MKNTKKIFDIETIIGRKSSIIEIREKLRARLQDIYLSEENLAKLEAFGFSRSEILMSRTPKEFISMASIDVLQTFGFCPHFKNDTALACMSIDYIIDNYSELIRLGAKIDYNLIFRNVPRELGEYYAEKLVQKDFIESDRLLARMHHKAVFFNMDKLLVNNARPERVLRRLDSKEIEISRETFMRYGLSETAINDRLELLAKIGENGAIVQNGKNGRVVIMLPIKSSECLNCGSSCKYYGNFKRNFCCTRCRETYMLKRQIREELIKELGEKKNASKN